MTPKRNNLLFIIFTLITISCSEEGPFQPQIDSRLVFSTEGRFGIIIEPTSIQTRSAKLLYRDGGTVDSVENYFSFEKISNTEYLIQAKQDSKKDFDKVSGSSLIYESNAWKLSSEANLRESSVSEIVKEAGMPIGLYIFDGSSLGFYAFIYIPKHLEIGESTWYVEKYYTISDGFLSGDWYDEIGSIGEPEFINGHWQKIGYTVKAIHRAEVDRYRITRETWNGDGLDGTTVISETCEYDHLTKIFRKFTIDEDTKYKFGGNKTINQFLGAL